MGRARNLSTFEVDNKIYALGNYYPKAGLYCDNITIDTTGHVLRCDYENDEVENLSIGNVLDKPLQRIIREKCIQEIKNKYKIYTDSEALEVIMNHKFMQKQFNCK